MKIFYRLLAITFLVMSLSSCSRDLSSDKLASFSKENLQQSADEEFLANSYIPALSYYDEIIKRFPFDSKDEANRIKAIYSSFKSNKLAEVGPDCEYFIKLYPKSKYADWIMFIDAYTYYNQYRNWVQNKFNFDRSHYDIKNIEQAYAMLQNLINLYPNSIYIAPAVKLQYEIRNVMFHHDLAIADMYYKQQIYLASALRATDIISKYPDNCDIDSAINILSDSYSKLGFLTWSKDLNNLKNN